MSKYVYVVTNPELGWDCVVGVYDCDAITLSKLQRCFPEDQYVIHEQLIMENFDE
jgi:hypothetical protein